MKKENVNVKEENEKNSRSGDEPAIIEPINPDTDPDTEGDGDGEEEDESGRPNRGTGTAGPKRPIGSGNKGQYSLRNPDGQDA